MADGITVNGLDLVCACIVCICLIGNDSIPDYDCYDDKGVKRKKGIGLCEYSFFSSLPSRKCRIDIGQCGDLGVPLVTGFHMAFFLSQIKHSNQRIYAGFKLLKNIFCNFFLIFLSVSIITPMRNRNTTFLPTDQ